MPTKTVDANPTKRFFVEMLTRDIELEDAVLDLLDNCLDGVMRHTEPDEAAEKPYDKFWAKIHFSKDTFTITDNCGGIDRSVAVKSAFRMGRPKDEEPEEELATVGVYGIGMKRAIFKLGRSSTVTSRTKTDAFEVTISPNWLDDDGSWELPLRTIAKGGTSGTTIEVRELHDVIAQKFGDEVFIENFVKRVATHYSFIIHKGFKVFVNKEDVSPAPVRFLLKLEAGTKRGVAPFLYESEFDDVDIKLAVGFTRPLPSNEDLEEEQQVKHSRDEAGWTVICNDRVVLYCDKTRLTGWGDAGVPGFHAQFNSIAGIIHFRSTNAIKLPVTTTKRGIDAGSEVYLFAKNAMREGMKYFTQYTYKLKDRAAEEREHVKAAPPIDLEALRKQIPEKSWTTRTNKDVKDKNVKERRFIPELPVTPNTSNEKYMRFARPLPQIRRVSQFLFGDKVDRNASEVGAEAFDWVHKKAKTT